MERIPRGGEAQVQSVHVLVAPYGNPLEGRNLLLLGTELHTGINLGSKEEITCLVMDSLIKIVIGKGTEVADIPGSYPRLLKALAGSGLFRTFVHRREAARQGQLALARFLCPPLEEDFTSGTGDYQPHRACNIAVEVEAAVGANPLVTAPVCLYIPAAALGAVAELVSFHIHQYMEKMQEALVLRQIAAGGPAVAV